MTIIGICEDFCPKSEYNQRSRFKQLHPVFEKDIAIKKYSRPSAGDSIPKPETLRPPKVLEQVVDHLFCNVLNEGDFASTYPFIWDRLWAVRQDMIFQQSECETSRRILVKCVRFYSISNVLGRDLPIKSFDPSMNDRHFIDTIHKLLSLYEKFQVTEEDRPEIEGLYLLWNLGDLKVIARAQCLNSGIRRKLKKSVKVATSAMHGNHYKCLKSIGDLCIIEFCAVFGHLDFLRASFVRALNTAYSSKGCEFPVEILSQWLVMDEVACREFVRCLGITVISDMVSFSKSKILSDNVKSKYVNPDVLYTLETDASSVLL